MPRQLFSSAKKISTLIEEYFNYIEGAFHLGPGDQNEGKPEGGKQKKIWDRDPEPPTLSGFIFHLGFNSRQEFDSYEANGKFAHVLKRGRLRIEAAYEKKLHQPAPTGAIFGLKNMGWNEKATEKSTVAQTIKSLNVEVTESGPKLTATEQEVSL